MGLLSPSGKSLRRKSPLESRKKHLSARWGLRHLLRLEPLEPRCLLAAGVQPTDLAGPPETLADLPAAAQHAIPAAITQEAKLTASGGASGDAFGWSVAVSGDTVVVGAPWAPVTTQPGPPVTTQFGPGVVYVFTKPSTGWSDTTTAAVLTPSDGGSGFEFGQSVAISGDTIVVLARGSTKDYLGALYVFTKPASGWASANETAELFPTAPVTSIGAYSGRVSISGGTLVASCRTTTSFAAACVFTGSGSKWTQAAVLTPSDGAAAEGFDDSLSVSGGTVVVGAAGDEVNGPYGLGQGPGAAYVFTKPATGWKDMTETAKLTPSDGQSGDLFGYSVAVSGNTVAVGSPNAPVSQGVIPTDGPGKAYVFTGSGSTWNQVAEILDPVGDTQDGFGTAVSISGNALVVGDICAPTSSSATQDYVYGPGEAYLYTGSGSAWGQTAELSASDGKPDDWFGDAVSGSGGTVAVGAPQAPCSTTPQGGEMVGPGAVYVSQSTTIPTITWNAPAAITYGTALGDTQLDATVVDPGSGQPVAGTFSYTPAAGTVLHAGAGQTLSVTFTPADTQDYAPLTQTTTITVNPAPLTIMPAIQVKVYGADLPTLTATYIGFVNGDTAASLTTPPTLTTTATAASSVADNPYPITASGAADSDYTISYEPGHLFVSDATPIITWPKPAAVTYGTTLGATQLDATATWTVAGTPGNVAGVFTYTPAAGTLLPPGKSQKLSVTFVPTDTDDYATLPPVTTTIDVNPLKLGAVIYVLDPAASGALSVAGTSVIAISGGVLVDSISKAGLEVSGSAQISATNVVVVGGAQVTGKAKVTPTPIPGSALSDPLADLPAPTPGATLGSVNFTSGTHTIDPGAYTNIAVSGTATLTLEPGIYAVGGFSVSGTASVTGGGVMIYNTGAISISGGTVNLTGATAAPYTGISIFQARADAGSVSISGGQVNLNGGVLYAVAAQLLESGTAQLNAELVVDKLQLTGGARIAAAAGPVNPSYSTIAVSKSQIALGGKITVTLTARDGSGVQETGGGLRVTFALATGSAGGTFGSVKDNGNGTYTVTFTGTTAGSDTITASMLIGGKSQVVASAPTLTVVGPVSLSVSTLAVSTTKPIASGGTVTVTLTAKDANGNQELGGGLKVKFALGSTATGAARGSFGKVTNSKNGTYTVTFTATTAGTNTVTATVLGQAFSSKPAVTVVPAAVSLSKSTIAVSTSKPIPVKGTATVTLTTRDANGNQETGGGLVVTFGLGSSAGQGTFSDVTDNGNGTYTATFTATVAGKNTITAMIGGNSVTSKSPAVTVASAGKGLSAQDAALMAVLVDSDGGTDDAAPEKHLSASDLWLFGEE